MMLFITTGATVTFKELLEFVLTDSFFQRCIDIGFTRLLLQYGNEYKDDCNISLKFVNECLSRNTALQMMQKPQDTFKIYEKSTVLGKNLKAKFLQVELFPYANNFLSYVRQATIVISHGGTGTLLDILKFHKPAIVIPNHTLMNDHQQDICDEFCKLGYIVSMFINESSERNLEFVNLCTSLLQGRLKLNTFEMENGDIIKEIFWDEMKKNSYQL